jgi:hypothetical protein
MFACFSRFRAVALLTDLVFVKSGFSSLPLATDVHDSATAVDSN